MKKLVVLLVSLAFCAPAFSQENSASGIDEMKFNFGFLIGYNSNTTRIVKTTDYRDNDSLYLQSITPGANSGFQFGPIVNLKVTNNIDLRFTPNLCFADRSITYNYSNPALNKTKQIESTYVDLPLDIKLKSVRHRNVRFYLIGGIRPGIDVISQKKFDDTDFDEVDKRVKLDRLNLAWEAGFGFDLYYLYFKMSPEIKISRGIVNVLKKENNRFSRPLDGLFAEVFQVNFCFE